MTSSGQSGELIGHWLARSGRRDRTFIATKGFGRIRDLDVPWAAAPDTADWSAARFVGAGAAALRTSLEGSLRQLGTKHIDLSYVHVDDRATPRDQSIRVREAIDRKARAGQRNGGGRPWFGYIRVYANPDEPVARKRVILRENLHPVNAPALRDAAERVLRGETVGSIIREWRVRGIRPVLAEEWSRSTLVRTLTPEQLAALDAV